VRAVSPADVHDGGKRVFAGKAGFRAKARPLICRLDPERENPLVRLRYGLTAAAVENAADEGLDFGQCRLNRQGDVQGTGIGARRWKS